MSIGPPAAPSGDPASLRRPYRVLLVNLAKGYGGPETRVRGQAHALQGVVERCAVAVVRGAPLHRRLEAEGIPCEPISAARTDPRLALELRRVIRRGAYRVVDAHNIQSIFWGQLAALLAGAPGRVTTLHSDYRAEYSGLRRIAYPALFQLMRPLTRHFVNVTEQLQASAVAAGEGDRNTLIPNMVAVPDRPFSGGEPSLAARLGWASDDFLVAVVGRLFPVKGQRHAIEAVGRLGDAPRVKLLLVGEGPQREELETQVASLGLADRVRFLGFRSDIPEILRSVDCVCLPSLWELLPYAALEGAAYARPIIATAVGGIRSLLTDGETALLVNPGDPEALATAIRRLAENPGEARRIALAGYQLVQRSFSAEQMRSRTLEVYDRALGISLSATPDSAGRREG